MAPDTVLQLGETEQLVTRSLRHWVVGAITGDARHWNRVWNDLAGALGQARAREALTALDKLVRLACTGEPGRFRCHPPCCRFLGSDELDLLAILSACQAGDRDTGAALAHNLVAPQHHAEFVSLAATLAREIGAAGLILPRRRSACAEPVPFDGEVLRPADATLH